MNDILVSIIIPIYNSEKTLRKCFDSLINQTYKNIEIICVNDCSKDNSDVIIEEYITKDDRIKLINHAENKNAGGSRNTGIRNAAGEYLCFVDNDDWLAIDAIETMVPYTNNGIVDIVVPKWCDYISDDNNVIIPNMIPHDSKDNNIHYSLKNGFRMLGCLIKRLLICDNDLYFPEKIFWEDNAICFSWLYASSEICPIDYLAYYYYQMPNSVSRSISFKKIEDRIMTTDMFVSILKDRGYYSKDKDLIDWKFLSLTCNTLTMLSRYKFGEVKLYYKEIKQKIDRCLPNIYFKDFSIGYRFILLYPKIGWFTLHYTIINTIVHLGFRYLKLKR